MGECAGERFSGKGSSCKGEVGVLAGNLMVDTGMWGAGRIKLDPCENELVRHWGIVPCSNLELRRYMLRKYSATL